MRILLRGLAVAALLVFVLGAYLWVELRSIEPVPEPALPGTLETRELRHGDRVRRVHVYRPRRLEPRPAVVLVFHGSMGEGAQARAGFGYAFDELAEEHGFLVAYPDGFDRHWNGCRKKGPYEANLQNVDDVGFALAIVDALAERDPVDRDRLFATGVSNGGQMALRLALEAPEHFRAVAPVIASLPTPDNLGCEPRRLPISIAILNGTEDPMNPFEGGKVALYGVWGDRGEVLSTEATLEAWREIGGLTAPAQRRWLADHDPEDGSRIQEISYREPARPLVRLLAVHGGGHTVPHPAMRMPRLLGRTNRDHRAADLLWAFFSEAPPRATYER